MALYGLTGAFLAAPGKRDELVAHMLEAADLMGAVPRCLLYLVSTTADADEVAITELWTDEAAHEASLQAPGVGETHREGTSGHRWHLGPKRPHGPRRQGAAHSVTRSRSWPGLDLDSGSGTFQRS